jgi:thiol-disulfide isomerase/thioredoxin
MGVTVVPQLSVPSSAHPHVAYLKFTPPVPTRRVVLLNFWATWCAPCRREIPELVALQREMRNKGVDVIGLTLEDPAVDRARVESFTRQFSINYRIGFLPEEMFRLFNVQDPRGPIPQTFIFDRQGRLIDHLKGFRRDFRQWAEGALQYAIDHS